MKKELSISKLFHRLANEGKEIAEYREHHIRLSELHAIRIELILKLKKIKEQFFIQQ